jgi:hypothetical protein
MDPKIGVRVRIPAGKFGEVQGDGPVLTLDDGPDRLGHQSQLRPLRLGDRGVGRGAEQDLGPLRFVLEFDPSSGIASVADGGVVQPARAADGANHHGPWRWAHTSWRRFYDRKRPRDRRRNPPENHRPT